ncbi:MAG: DUF6062 family protein [Thermomicrobiales bacterium]
MPPLSRNLRLDDALALPGCPVCRIVLQRVAQTIETIQDELVLDPAYRERVDAAWGFCSTHAAQWLAEAQPLSTAIIYEAVLGRISRELERVSPTRTGLRGQLGSRISGGRTNRECAALVEARPCPLCVTRAEQERELVAQLLDGLRTASFRERYLSSDGLCVSHLNHALCAGPSAEALDALRSRLLRTHETLRADLREVIRKHDYRYQDEPQGAEWNAVEQAVRHVAGAPGIDGRRARSSTAE